MESFFLYGLGAILVIYIGKYIAEWYHEIPKRNRYMEAQIRLLSQIALSSGVSVEKVTDILANASLPGKKEMTKEMQDYKLMYERELEKEDA